jgi:uncharacterized protein YdhG (YjbR/CyaY superfamily)
MKHKPGTKPKARAKSKIKSKTKSKPKSVATLNVKPKTIDEYFARLADDQRAALEKLRNHIQAAAPAAVECISYQLPAFRLNGKLLVAFGAWANHCAFYPGAVMEDLGVELMGYDTSKGTIRFLSTDPLPAALVRKLVKARIAKDRFRQQPGARRG